MGKTLDKIIETDDSQLADDDHPERKDISEKEARQAMKELVEKYKDQPKNEQDDPKKLAKETIKALNKINATK